MDTAEILKLHGDLFIAFIKGVPPILGRRIKYYSDPLFRRVRSGFALIVLLLIALIAVWFLTQ
jgi:type IV secretory pathway TraG/TraD family ATPase VirD4